MPYEINPNKILRHPEEIAVLRDGGVPRVLNVEVDLSETCNLSCSHCDFPFHYPCHMTKETAEQTISRLDAWGTGAVVFTGGGEPTMCPDFEWMVKAFGRLFPLGLYTNGVHDNWVALAKKFAWTYVSLDAASAPEWELIKGGDPKLFRKVLGNVRNAAKETTVGVGFLIDECNCANLEQMIDVGLDAGASYVHFRPKWLSKVGHYTDALEALEALDDDPRVVIAWDKFKDALLWNRTYTTCWASMLLRNVDAAGNIWVCPTTRYARQIGTVWNGEEPDTPLPVTDECRDWCRGHGMNKTLQYVMGTGPHDAFV